LRLQKYLSRAGVTSRREAERWILQGRVAINGTVVRELGVRVAEGDRVKVDGRLVEVSEVEWVMLHKPVGQLTTRRDPGGAPTVYDSLPDRYQELPYVGRLDRETEGLLLFTNDGDVAHALLHPSTEVPREYQVWVDEPLTPGTRELLLSGVPLEDGPARALEVSEGTRDGSLVRFNLVVAEGRKREVRRMMESVNRPARRLRRIRFGLLQLDPTLTVGAWKRLDDADVRLIRQSAGKT
jgi:23S rRNA pseudouridine2605 synthase